VHGACIGGGVDLISACDVRLCTQDAKFSVKEVKVAIVADLGSLQRLPPIIGQGHTRELALTGKTIDAARALRIGLVNDVLETPEALAAAAGAMAAEIAANPPLTVRGVKDVLDFGADRSVADGLAYVAAHNAAFLASEDLGEAIAAFMEKREPRFQGK
jgi:enoyl-CoA hydratase